MFGMLRFWQSKSRVYQPQGIYIGKSALHGRGVFAGQLFKPGDIIEEAPVVLLDNSEKACLQHTSLFGYYFLTPDERNSLVFGLGYSSLYNHFCPANAGYTLNLQKRLIIIRAIKAIQRNEEIVINYTGDPDNTSPVYFPE